MGFVAMEALEANAVSLARRIVLIAYGLAVACVLTWIPWRGYGDPIYQVPKERWNATFLGYGLIWFQLKPPQAFVKYEIENAKYSADYAHYQKSHSGDCIPGWKSGIVGFVQPQDKEYCAELQPGAPLLPPPKEPVRPEGYISPGIYRWAEPDYGRI